MDSKQQLSLLIVLVFGLVWCQDANQIEQQLKDIQDSGQFNKSAEDLDKAFREKCDKNGGPGAYDAIKDSQAEVQQCFESQINVTVLTEELEEAKKTGSMDEVFAKYCQKTPQFISCTKTVTDKVTQCLNPEEKDNMKIVLNVTENLGKFVCDKNGDRLAMFVAEGGKECLEERKEDLQLCVNKTFSSRVPTDISMETLPLLLFDDQQCEDFTKLQNCVIAELEVCKDKTPANIVEALFKFIYKSMPCKKAETHNSVYKRETNNNNETAVTQAPFDEREYIDQVMRSIFYIKCQKYADKNRYFAVEKAVRELQVAMRSVYLTGMTCTTYKKDVIAAMRRVMLEAGLCLPPAEKYLTNFFLTGTDSVLNHLCPTDSMDRLLGLFKPEALQCLATGNKESLNKCLYLSQSQKQVYDNELIVSKPELCADLGKMKNCLINYVSLQCGEFEQFKGIVTTTLESSLVACKGESGVNAKLAPESTAVRFSAHLLLNVLAFVYILHF